MLIRLDEYYTRYTEGFSDHELNGATAYECMGMLLNRYSQLMVRMFENDSELLRRSAMKFNGEFTEDPKLGELLVSTTDTLEITCDIPTGSGEVGKWIGAIVMFVVGVVLMIIPGTQILGMSSFYLGLSMVAGAIASAIVTVILTPDVPDPVAPQLLNNSATYTFDGIKNTTPSGTPIQIVYGSHRVGGHVLNMYLVNENKELMTVDGNTILSYDYLMAQIGLCEGEIDSASSVLINNDPVSFYNEVETFEDNDDFLRLGTKDQVPMKDFTSIRNTASLNLKVNSASEKIESTVLTADTTSTPVYGVIVGSASYPTQITLGKFEAIYNYVPESQG